MRRKLNNANYVRSITLTFAAAAVNFSVLEVLFRHHV